MTSSRLVFFYLGYFLIAVFLFFYSFTQIDLGLTLTRLSLWQAAQRWFQHVGYFDRPLSTYLYIGIIVSLFVAYIGLLYYSKKNRVKEKKMWILIIGVAMLLVPSYNAFSYDLFNYIFDAKIITFYNEDPYVHKALDYPQDKMLAFMHWTHRVYPYGPLWLALTVPFSFLGAHLFLPTFFLFKIGITASYLGTVYFVSKIAEKIAPEKKTFLTLLFALNPLVIIESIVSAHNDIAMMFFAVWGLFLLLQKKYIVAFLLLAISMGIKFATIFLLPTFCYVVYCQLKDKHVNWQKVFIAATIVMLIPVIFASQRTELQPWYLLWFLPFAALAGGVFTVSSITLSFGLLLHYVPYLYTGNWNPPIPTINFWISLINITLSVIAIFFVNLNKKSIRNK